MRLNLYRHGPTILPKTHRAMRLSPGPITTR